MIQTFPYSTFIYSLTRKPHTSYTRSYKEINLGGGAKYAQRANKFTL